MAKTKYKPRKTVRRAVEKALREYPSRGVAFYARVSELAGGYVARQNAEYHVAKIRKGK